MARRVISDDGRMSDAPGAQVPQQILQLAISPEVPDRMEAGQRLAPYAGQPTADALLHRLLLDDETPRSPTRPPKHS